MKAIHSSQALEREEDEKDRRGNLINYFESSCVRHISLSLYMAKCFMWNLKKGFARHANDVTMWVSECDTILIRIDKISRTNNLRR